MYVQIDLSGPQAAQLKGHRYLQLYSHRQLCQAEGRRGRDQVCRRTARFSRRLEYGSEQLLLEWSKLHVHQNINVISLWSKVDRLDTSAAPVCGWKSCPVKVLMDAQRWAQAQSLNWGHSSVITHHWRGGRSQARLRQWYKACTTYWCCDNAQCRRHMSPFYSQKRCSEQRQQAISGKPPSQSSLLSMAFHKKWRASV